jgi:hypothetical protein
MRALYLGSLNFSLTLLTNWPQLLLLYFDTRLIIVFVMSAMSSFPLYFHTSETNFFLLERPNLFAICNNTGKGEGWHVEEYSVAVRGSETGGDSGQ